MKTGIKKAILQTMLFYDMFDFPLTNQEIFDNLLFWRCSPIDVLDGIEQLLDSGQIYFDRGFYHLPNRNEVVDIRKSRYLESFRKWQIVKRYDWIFNVVPFVKMVGVGNTLAYSNAKADGDIDLLVVVKRRRMFIARTILTGLALIFDMWRFGDRVKNRFCLSFFLSEDNLDLSRIKLSHEDIYLAFWTKWLKPVYCDDLKVAERYWRKNKWVMNYFPNTAFHNPVVLTDKKTWLKERLEYWLNSTFGNFWENILGRLQVKKIKSNTPEFNQDGTIANTEILKFHPTGVRDKYYQNWKKRVEKLD